MRHVWDKQHTGAVSRIGTGCGKNYQEYKDQAMVERLIMENNGAWFRLMEDMPLMQEPLLSEMGYLADMLAAAQTLNSTYVWPPVTDSFTHNFLACMQHPPSMGPEDQILMMITKEDFQAYWKSQRKELHPLCQAHTLVTTRLPCTRIQ